MMSSKKHHADDVYEACSFRNTFSTDEDEKLIRLVNESGDRPVWRVIATKMVGKSPRQCRERYKNYLSPSLLHQKWTSEEDSVIISKHEELGNRWMAISRCLKGRSGNDVRNRWQTLARRHCKDKKHSAFSERKDSLQQTPPGTENNGKSSDTDFHDFSVLELIDKIFDTNSNKLSMFNCIPDDSDLFEIFNQKM